MSEPVKLCKDCRHFSGRMQFADSRCMHPAIAKVDLVFGHRVGENPWKVRQYVPCGPEGNLWEPKT